MVEIISVFIYFNCQTLFTYSSGFVTDLSIGQYSFTTAPQMQELIVCQNGDCFLQFVTDIDSPPPLLVLNFNLFPLPFYNCQTMLVGSIRLQRVSLGRYTTAGSCGVLNICKKSWYSTKPGKLISRLY